MQIVDVGINDGNVGPAAQSNAMCCVVMGCAVDPEAVENDVVRIGIYVPQRGDISPRGTSKLQSDDAVIIRARIDEDGRSSAAACGENRRHDFLGRSTIQRWTPG